MLQLFEYELSFKSAFKTGAGEFNHRKGVLIHYREDNTDFVSEASPLPGFSTESIDQVRRSLTNQKKWIERFLERDFTIESIRELANFKNLNEPSIQFALSYLSLSILANREDKSIFELFDKEPPSEIPVNDVIGHDSTLEMKNKIQSSIDRGFRVLKIKAPYPFDDLAAFLASIHKNHTDVQFRLDANQSWPISKLDRIINELKHLPIEYIEEPCRVDNLEEFKEIQGKSNYPIALDESISTIDHLKTALSLYPNFILIIKPMLLGNILKIHETIFRFRSSFKKIVVTTMLESKIGRTMTASTASLIGDPKMRHGLHTGHLFADDLLPDFDIKNGSIKNLQKNPVTDSFSDIKTSYIKKLR